jgi:hypothetical protein
LQCLRWLEWRSPIPNWINFPIHNKLWPVFLRNICLTVTMNKLAFN